MIVCAIYFSGYVLAYILLRKCFIKKDWVWSYKDRGIGLFASIGSWITVIVALIELSDDNKPAKW